MEAPLKKTVVHLALVCLILILQLFTTGQCSDLDKNELESGVEVDEHNQVSPDEKTLSKRSLHHSYQSGLVSDFAYSLPSGPAYQVIPQYVKQIVPAPAPAVPAVAPTYQVVKPLVFPAYQQKIIPGNAFVTSHSVTFPRYPVVQRPVVYAAAAPVAPVAPVLPAIRPFVQIAPAPIPFPNPVQPALLPSQFIPQPAPIIPQPVPQLPPPPPPPPVPAAPAVRPFIIVTKPLPPPPPPAPIVPAPAFVPFAVAAPVPCHHQSNMPSNVPSPSQQENFGFIPMQPQKPWQHGGSSSGGGSYLPPSSHSTYKRAPPPLRLSITSKYRPHWK